jgi:hypothetical protein
MDFYKKGNMTMEQGIVIFILLAFLVLMIAFAIAGPKNILDGFKIPLGGP